MRFESAIWPLSGLRISDALFANPRTHSGLEPADLRELAIKILRDGLYNPLIVTTDGLVIAGSRRYRAMNLLTRWREDSDLVRELSGSTPDRALTTAEADGIDARVAVIIAAVPVRILWPLDPSHQGPDLEGVALADNLLRFDLSSYEIAARLAVLADQGLSGLAIARLIGKSPSYVSRKLSAWKKASPELLAAWRDGLAEEQVVYVASLPLSAQPRELAGPVPRGRRGPAARPTVDVVRDFLLELEQRPALPGKQLAIGREAREIAYLAGARDALRWVTGADTSPDFAKLAKDT